MTQLVEPCSKLGARSQVRSHQAVAHGAITGLLVGDALGLPYEYGRPSTIPPSSHRLDMKASQGRMTSHPVPQGTWSDDGAAALCVLWSLTRRGHFDLEDLADALVAWMTRGAMTVDGHVFDIGIQTTEALSRVQRGVPARQAGLRGVRNNGNGSLMRVLPLALQPNLGVAELVGQAFSQSRITHGHPRALVCCGLYVLWARHEMSSPDQSSEDNWGAATEDLRRILPRGSAERTELEQHVRPDAAPWGTGSGYVVDSLHSARWACHAKSYEQALTRAIALGNDTDTTASLTGGIAGIRFGSAGIPERWLRALRGLPMARELVGRFLQHFG